MLYLINYNNNNIVCAVGSLHNQFFCRHLIYRNVVILVKVTERILLIKRLGFGEVNHQNNNKAKVSGCIEIVTAI